MVARYAIEKLKKGLMQAKEKFHWVARQEHIYKNVPGEQRLLRFLMDRNASRIRRAKIRQVLAAWLKISFKKHSIGKFVLQHLKKTKLYHIQDFKTSFLKPCVQVEKFRW